MKFVIATTNTSNDWSISGFTAFTIFSFLSVSFVCFFFPVSFIISISTFWSVVMSNSTNIYRYAVRISVIRMCTYVNDRGYCCSAK